MRSFKAAPEVLSAWMDERKLTAAELSRQTGIDAGILRKIMTGRETAVSTRNLMTLARYFGLSMQELIDAFFRTNNDERPHLRPLLSVHTMFTASDLASNLQFDGICWYTMITGRDPWEVWHHERSGNYEISVHRKEGNPA